MNLHYQCLISIFFVCLFRTATKPNRWDTQRWVTQASGLGHQSVFACILFSRLYFRPKISHQSKVQQCVSPVNHQLLFPTYVLVLIKSIPLQSLTFPCGRIFLISVCQDILYPLWVALFPSFLPSSLSHSPCSWNAGLLSFRCICCRNRLISCVFFFLLLNVK